MPSNITSQMAASICPSNARTAPCSSRFGTPASVSLPRNASISLSDSIGLIARDTLRVCTRGSAWRSSRAMSISWVAPSRCRVHRERAARSAWSCLSREMPQALLSISVEGRSFMSLVTAARVTKPEKRSSGNAWLNDPEVHLMLLVQRDDAAAFAELVKRYWTQVFGQAFRKLRDREEAEDLAQEVFLRLYRHRKRYQPRAKFATWLFHIAQNVFRNALRSRRRHPTVRFDSLAGRTSARNIGEDGLPDRAESPSLPIERAELARAVRTAVSGLASRQRRAVELHQFKDHTYVEVAAELDVTAKAAKSLLYRARNQLRTSLHSYVAANA